MTITAEGGLNSAQIAILTQATPPQVVKTRRGRGGARLSYVSHDYVTRTLNEAFGWKWSFTIVDSQVIGGDEPTEVVVRGRLVVHTESADIIKEQFGGSDVKRLKSGQAISLADDFKAASSDALKKCASLLGIALDLYGDTPPTPPAATANATVAMTVNGDGPKAKFFRRVQANLGLAVMRAVKIMRENGFDQYDEAKEEEMWGLLKEFAEEKALPIAD